MTNTTSHRLIGWGTFEDLNHGILARTFGVMVELAVPVVKEYHSDLFHDAEWLRANVKGETTFEFVVRDCGTNLGESARYAKTSPGAVLYTLTLRSERSRPGGSADWWLDVTKED